MSQITTHILDTSLGKPAAGIHIHLQQKEGGNWATIASGVTNDDGRIADLMPSQKTVPPGIYRMFFEVKPYFEAQSIQSFYPEVAVIFETFDESHYHVPLLLNPFGYATYRGS